MKKIFCCPALELFYGKKLQNATNLITNLSTVYACSSEVSLLGYENIFVTFHMNELCSVLVINVYRLVYSPWYEKYGL